jgi:hypothetical protein
MGWQDLQAIDQGTLTVTRLRFEIGYYTTEDLQSMKPADDYQRVSFDKSGEWVDLLDHIEEGIWQRERGTGVTVDGAEFPFRKWIKPEKTGLFRDPPREYIRGLWRVIMEPRGTISREDFEYARHLFSFDPNLLDDVDRRLGEVYTQLSQGTLAPAQLNQRLDAILSKADRAKRLGILYRKAEAAAAPEAPRLTPLQALQDLFYDCSLDLEQYRYAQQLLSIDRAQLDGPARRIADLYTEVAEGKVKPSELSQRLDKILSRADREKLLADVQKKSAQVHQKK